MAAGATRAMGEYATANVKERVEIILDSYPSFLEIIDGSEESLKCLIIDRGKMAERRSGGDLGVRVQMSGLSSLTANAAVDSVVPTEAVRGGNVDAELKGIECPKQYRKEAEVIREMRDDYSLVKAQIETLSWQDYRVLDSCLNGSHDLAKLAEEADYTYDGVKNRLKRAKNRIRKSTTLYLERKYENN